MNNKLYNTIVFFFFVASVFAQRTDKKYTEKFYTNNKVEIVINASNADVEVQNWNKNEVLVEASIEVEGVSKKEAQKYIDKWKFEALGNKSKVKINASGANQFGFGSDDFILFNNYPNTKQNLNFLKNGATIISGDTIFVHSGKKNKGEFFLNSNDVTIGFEPKNVAFPEVTTHTLNGNVFLNDYTYLGMGTIILPDLEMFEFPSSQADNLFRNFDKLTFDEKELERNGEDYVYRWSYKKKEIKIKTKEEWERFKKTKEYKRLRKTMKDGKKIAKAQKQLRKEYEKLQSNKGIGGMYLKNISSNFWFPNIHGDMIFTDIDNVVFDFNKYAEIGDEYFFKWKDDFKEISINSKKEWKKFKKSKEYKKLKKELEKSRAEYLLKNRQEKLKKLKTIKSKKNAQTEIYFWDKDKNQYQFRLEKKPKTGIYVWDDKNKTYNFFDGSSKSKLETKSVKIRKKITIKVPKNATFNLNTRHCKVRLPNAKVSGKVSYGTFNADGLVGGNLNVYSSPVDINTLTTCTLFLNNVKTANVSSMNNATLKSSSTDVFIDEVLKNVTIDNSFGKLYVAKFNKNFERANINLSQTDAYLTFGSNKPQFTIDISEKLKGSWNSDAMKINKNSTKIFGNFTVKSKKNASDTFSLTAKYSKLTIN